MNRDEARDRILDYAYGEMSDKDRADFEAILAQDNELQREVASIGEIRDAVRGLPQVPLPEDVRQRILDAAHERVEASRQTARPILEALRDFFLSPALLGTLAVLIAVGVGMDLVLDHGTEDRLDRLDREEHVAVMKAREPAMIPAERSPGQAMAVVESPEREEAGPKEEAEFEGSTQVDSRAVAPSALAKGDMDEAVPRTGRRPARPRMRSDALVKGSTGRLQEPGDGAGAEGMDASAGASQDGNFGGAGGLISGGASGRAGTAGILQTSPSKAAKSAAAVDGSEAPSDGSREDVRDARTREQSLTSLMAGETSSKAKKAAGYGTDKPAADRAPVAAESISVDSVEESADLSKADSSTEYRRLLARARSLRDRGLPRDALAVYRRILAGSPPADLLHEALKEAADVAEGLGLTNEARDYRNRLVR
jgi:hypothetical protein